jgi:large subunit ribosomal protein L11
MAKKVVKKIKLQITAGAATAAPPVGTVLGPAGINIGEFVAKFNEATRELAGNIIPAEISVYDDRSFDFILKQPPASRLILKAIGREKGSSKNLVSKAGEVSMAQLHTLAEQKIPDMNAGNIDAAVRTLAGTARSMGVEVK